MARWPPAEKPMMPMRLGSMPHSRALAGSLYLGQLTELALLNNWAISTGQRLVLRKRFGDRVRL
jgi:hypothetical protein